jgi:predicted hotdog family 3-hydroxylacyl-ACP dehydratase
VSANVSLSKTEISGLVPHTGSMCLLEAVHSWTDDEIVCTATSHHDRANPLRRGDRLPAIAGVEYAAQAMGVHGRLAAKDNTKPAAGFLLSLRDLVLSAERIDDVSGPLTVRARRLADTGGTVMCAFDVSADGRTLVTGRATLLLEAQ